MLQAEQVDDLEMFFFILLLCLWNVFAVFVCFYNFICYIYRPPTEHHRGKTSTSKKVGRLASYMCISFTVFVLLSAVLCVVLYSSSVSKNSSDVKIYIKFTKTSC